MGGLFVVSIIVILVLIVAVFACFLDLLGGIFLITGIIKKGRGRATKLKKVAAVLFIVSFICWMVPAAFILLSRLFNLQTRWDYEDTGVKVQVTEESKINGFEWEGERLVPLEREYFDIGEKSKKKAVCNIEYVDDWKWLTDLMGFYEIDTMYQVENRSGYPIYIYGGWIGCPEGDREAVLEYYDNKVPLTYYYSREGEEEEPWPADSFDKDLQKELESCQEGQREQMELPDSAVSERIWISAYSEDRLRQEEWEILIVEKQAYICTDEEYQEGIDHCVPLTKESGAYILKTLEQ